MLQKNLKNRLLLNIILFFLIFFNIFCHAGENSGQGLSVGETIPNPEIRPLLKLNTEMISSVKLQDYKAGKNLLIAFMPSVTDKNSYSKIMSAAFDTYFAEGLSFGASYNYYYQNPDLKILIVTPDNEQAVNEYLQKWDLDFEAASDKNMDIANYFGIREWTSNSQASQVYLVNKDNKIVYADYDYMGQGEKLKTVQSELYSLLNIKDNVIPFKESNPLMAGDDAKDFVFQYVNAGRNEIGSVTINGKLSDYKGKKNVLIAFYPAPYSISCSMQVSTFDQYAEKQKMIDKVSGSGLNNDGGLEILMVSISNAGILAKWKNEMNLENVKLVNDVTGEISMLYNSYSQYGYNKRTIFLVDKEGKISYVNWNYKVDDDDFALMKDRITALK